MYKSLISLLKNVVAMMIISNSLFLSSCNDGDIDDSMKLSLLYIEQSKTCWNGSTNNYFINVYNSQQTDTVITISLALYQNHKDKIEPVTVDIIVDTDSLNNAITLSGTNNSLYSIYKKAKPLPEEYYTIPDKISLDNGQNSNDVQIILHKDKILENAHTTEQGGTFIIPVKIANPTKYRINENVYFVMFILRFPGNQLDPTQPDPSKPAEIPGYTLYWNDEFNGIGRPDSKYWNFEEGFARNEELQWYQAENAICGGGILTIYGKKEQVKNPNYDKNSSEWRRNREYAEYTSSSITTTDKMHFKFGRIEIRAKIPTATGAWPAIWTLGEKWEWPSSGEIDILEYYISGGEPKILINWAWGSNDRWSGQWNSWSRAFSDFTKDDPEWASKFHTWMMDWEADRMSVYIDGVCWRDVANTMTNQASFGSDQSKGENPFHQPHYILLNLALGANGGDPSGSTFPMKYEIDYVRVYQKK